MPLKFKVLHYAYVTNYMENLHVIKLLEVSILGMDIFVSVSV